MKWISGGISFKTFYSRKSTTITCALKCYKQTYVSIIRKKILWPLGLLYMLHIILLLFMHLCVSNISELRLVERCSFLY